jgi:hypothetical protein
MRYPLGLCLAQCFAISCVVFPCSPSHNSTPGYRFKLVEEVNGPCHHLESLFLLAACLRIECSINTKTGSNWSHYLTMRLVLNHCLILPKPQIQFTISESSCSDLEAATPRSHVLQSTIPNPSHLRRYSQRYEQTLSIHSLATLGWTASQPQRFRPVCHPPHYYRWAFLQPRTLPHYITT